MDNNTSNQTLPPPQPLPPPPPPPPISDPPQPPSKKTKMSSTTTTSDEETTTTPHDGTASRRRYKRRKVAIFFAYCGVGYQGMQKNPGAKTIEGDFEEALYHSGAVPDHDRGQPKRFDWARSARTDKGVSAVGQVVSGRFYVDPDGFVERLNSNLSPQIRVFGYKRVTGAFNAKKFCDRRRYVYLLPVFALDPVCHRDRESVLASLGSEGELVKCLECSERGRKVVGLMGNRRDFGGRDRSGISSNGERRVEGGVDVDGTDNGARNGDEVMNLEGSAQSGILSNSVSALVGSEENGEGRVESSVCVDGMDNGARDDDEVVNLQGSVQSGISSSSEAAMVVDDKEEEKELCGVGLGGNGAVIEGEESAGNLNGCGNGEEEIREKRSEFKYGDEERQRFNRILQNYVGTRNFHNFTTRTKAEDPSAIRYILSFEANTTLMVEGIEFIKCEVVGQSFMLHQIRKMMGLAVSVMRNFAPESIFEKAFERNVRINVPTAPEVGLYLDECFFSSYNNKWKHSHEEVSMKDYAEEAEEFKLKHIYSHIGKTEHKEGAVGVWLHSLNYRNYPDLSPINADVGATIEKKSTEVEMPLPAEEVGVAALEVETPAEGDGVAAPKVETPAEGDGVVAPTG